MIDDDLRTLHIRCGSDIRQTLTKAGFVGDFLEYSDPICEGPVPDISGPSAVRVHYLYKSLRSGHRHDRSADRRPLGKTKTAA